MRLLEELTSTITARLYGVFFSGSQGLPKCWQAKTPN